MNRDVARFPDDTRGIAGENLLLLGLTTLAIPPTVAIALASLFSGDGELARHLTTVFFIEFGVAVFAGANCAYGNV